MEQKELTFQLVMEYKKENLKKANEDLKTIGNFKKSSFEIKGELVHILHNKKHYFMYDETEHLFMGNNVDNEDFLTTFKIDVQKYGLVMLALKNPNKNYFLELVSTPEKEYHFVQHLKYVLSFATMRVGDKVISLKDYFGTPSEDVETVTCSKCGFTNDLANSSGFNYEKMICFNCSYDEQLKTSFENVRERQIAIQQETNKKFFN